MSQWAHTKINDSPTLQENYRQTVRNIQEYDTVWTSFLFMVGFLLSCVCFFVSFFLLFFVLVSL